MLDSYSPRKAEKFCEWSPKSIFCISFRSTSWSVVSMTSWKSNWEVCTDDICLCHFLRELSDCNCAISAKRLGSNPKLWWMQHFNLSTKVHRSLLRMFFNFILNELNEPKSVNLSGDCLSLFSSIGTNLVLLKNSGKVRYSINPLLSFTVFPWVVEVISIKNFNTNALIAGIQFLFFFLL